MQLDTGIFISDKAKERVESLLKEQGKENDHFLRVSVVSGGCSGLSYKMDFDNAIKPTDQVFEDRGMKIVTDFKSVLYLFNTTLEYTEGLNGKGFHFSNPNASRTCACGESFSDRPYTQHYPEGISADMGKKIPPFLTGSAVGFG
jgi:iron-sulfur cluster assembly protein